MPVESLRDRVARGPLLLDGAMGTELYRRGQFINKPFEGVNLSDPELVERVHRDYAEAGAEVLETNTFASNRLKLARVGLEDRFEAINRAGVALARKAAGDRAYVVGAVGPTGVIWGSLTAEQQQDAIQALVEQIDILVDAGVDGIILETFAWFAELLAVIQAVRPRLTLPLWAHVSFIVQGATTDAVQPAEAARELAAAGVDVLGANCADGPHELFQIAEQMIGHGVPVCIFPNAGYPKKVDDRMIYMATPEYFLVFARRFLKLGVRIVGGCCGTTPDHIRAMAGAVRMLGSSSASPTPVVVRDIVPQRQAELLTPSPFSGRSRLASRIAADDGFVVSVEVNPPTGLDPTKAIEAARMLKAAGVDVINIADGPRASVRMSNWALGLQVRQQVGMECIIHVCMRDRNLLGLQSDILAYESLGLNNLVVITGDPPKMGDYPNATAVFDLDSIGALQMIHNFNQGVNPAGRALGGQTNFVLACGVEPAATDYDRELRRLEEKVRAGADFIMTQPVYDSALLDRLLTDIQGFRKPVLIGLLPLASSRNAEFLHNEVPGMQIPLSIRERMERAGQGVEARREGVRIAQEALLAVRDRVRGAYIMPPFGRYEAALEILECVGYPLAEPTPDVRR
jgi:methionine synthase I (cobalamin-dependent)/5,10-methylenetetrahydrofolate reductase